MNTTNTLRLTESFIEKNFSDGEDMNEYIPIFNFLAEKFSDLKFNDAYVDVGKEDKIVEFWLAFNSGIRIDIRKCGEFINDNMVFFSVHVDDECYVINSMDADKLKEHILNIISKIK